MFSPNQCKILIDHTHNRLKVAQAISKEDLFQIDFLMGTNHYYISIVMYFLTPNHGNDMYCPHHDSKQVRESESGIRRFYIS